MDRQTGRQANRQTQTEMGSYSLAGRQADEEISRQAGSRQTDKQTEMGRQANRTDGRKPAHQRDRKHHKKT